MTARRDTGAKVRRAGRAWLVRAAACLVAATFASPPAAQPAAAPLERPVKAAFVYKFLAYVEWPAQAFERPDAPLVIGVAGADDIAAELQQIVAGRAVGDRPLQVKRLREGDPVAGLHVVFVGRSETARIPALARALQGRPTLIVSEAAGALDAGSMINLVIAPDGRVRFEVALEPAEKGGLKLSSRMLALAQAVRPGGIVKLWVSRSIRDKVIFVMLATTFVALLVAGISLVIYETRSYRESSLSDLATQADVLALTSAPALAFDDPDAARENLAVMRVRPGVLASAVYTRDGRLFASYARSGSRADEIPDRPGDDGARIEGDRIRQFLPIVERGERVGTVYVVAEYALLRRLQNYLAILGAVLVLSLGVALIVSALMQAAITGPILAVTDVAHRVMDQRDFSLRVKRKTDDEIGYLVDAFNAMLAEVGRRADEIEASNRSLQSEMVERRGAEEALRAADRRKDEFLATLAHELRNPLAPLRNGLVLLKMADTRPEVAQQARDMMERQLDQMVRLVDDLLDVSRIATGKLTLRKERVELQAVVRNAIETVNPFLRSRGHELRLALPERPVLLDADPTRLAQVFSNLLNNAARYTERGGTIMFDVTADGPDVVARVIDTGIGIDPSMLERVFELFAQADQSLERQNAGLGVGLTLAKFLVGLHGGTLVARSEGLGRGSEFVVRLPIARDARFDRAAQPGGEPGGASGGHRVLIVDDNRDFASSLEALLSALGNDVRVANDGEEGLGMATTFAPHIAFLDIGMPRMNGYRLAEELRSRPAFAGTRLIALTGWGQEKDRRRAHEAGFDQHLVKPVKLEQIVAILRTLPAA